MAEHEEALPRLALHDEGFIESMLAMHLKDDQPSGLDGKTHALVRLGALVALGAAPVSYQWTVGVAIDAGATADDIVGILIAVAPSVGSPASSWPPLTSPSRWATTSTPRSSSTARIRLEQAAALTPG